MKPEQKRFPDDIVPLVSDLLDEYERNTLQAFIKTIPHDQYEAKVGRAKKLILDGRYEDHLNELKAEAKANNKVD